ncbi:MAG: DNA mismatch repair protein MutS, partial [Armatimonadetes bacterium]|nr:DNA mismatch repair protein MutS [Armatimonadota bacterium]
MSDAMFSPMYRQFRELKQRYPGVLLLFRLGDFYEMFEDDAETAARALELTLTSREMGKGRRVAMCGIPYHALDRYLPRLVRQGLRAAICEQVEDPKQARGLVRREVVRVVTPGTLTEETMLEAAANNYLVALADAPRQFALAVIDVSTGHFQVTELSGDDARARLLDELERLQPAELLWPLTMQAAPDLREVIEQQVGAAITMVDGVDADPATARALLCRHFGVASLHGYGLEEAPLQVQAAATALRYVSETQADAAVHIVGLASYQTSAFMSLDAATRRNLELTLTLREGSPGKGTLLWLLDETCTPMGARLLRSWLVRPLHQPEPIETRLEAVAACHRDILLRDDLRAGLHKVADLERLLSKAATG